MRALMVVGVLVGLLSSATQALSATLPFARTVRATCGASETCTVTFQTLATGTRWEVKQVGCVGTLRPTSLKVALAGFQVLLGPNLRNTYPFVPVLSGIHNTEAYWVIQDEAFIPLTPGMNLRAFFTTAGDPTLHVLECVISGLQITN